MYGNIDVTLKNDSPYSLVIDPFEIDMKRMEWAHKPAPLIFPFTVISFELSPAVIDQSICSIKLHVAGDSDFSLKNYFGIWISCDRDEGNNITLSVDGTVSDKILYKLDDWSKDEDHKNLEAGFVCSCVSK